MTGSALHVRQISVRYGGHLAVDRVDLDLPSGQVLALLGPNGAGKSTLIRAIAQIGPRSTGQVAFGTHDLAEISTRARARMVAYLPQDTSIDLAFTVVDLVRLGRYAHLGRWGGYRAVDERIVREAMDRVGVTALADRPVPSLSGGQRQLVLLAKALAQQASFLLLDEPISALDPHHQLRVLGLLRELAHDGMGVGVVLHDLNLAARFADQLTVMGDAVVVAHGAPHQVLTAELLAQIYRIAASVGIDSATGAVHMTALHPLTSPQEDPCPVPV